MKLDELEKLLSKATVAPWFGSDYDISTDKEVSAGWHINNHKVIATTYDGEYVENPNHANDSKFITEFRNNAEEMLRVIRAAMDVVGDAADHDTHCICRLEDALSKLDAT